MIYRKSLGLACPVHARRHAARLPRLPGRAGRCPRLLWLLGAVGWVVVVLWTRVCQLQRVSHGRVTGEWRRRSEWALAALTEPHVQKRDAAALGVDPHLRPREVRSKPSGSLRENDHGDAGARAARAQTRTPRRARVAIPRSGSRRPLAAPPRRAARWPPSLANEGARPATRRLSSAAGARAR